MIQSYIDQHKDRILDELKELLSMPSISAVSEYNDHTRKTAEWLKDHFTTIGLKNSKLIDVDKHPIVYADWLEAGEDKPTIMIYGHYDVQDPGNLEEWESAPFEPTIRGEHLYARGATDNKGQFFTHIKALEAMLRSHGSLPVNVMVVIEGEEESGGKALPNWLLEHKDQLNVDAVIIADSEARSEHVPAIEYGLRGMFYCEVTAHGPKSDVHSGIFGGGIANPINALAQLIASMQDPQTGNVRIPGFYDDVVGVGEEEREVLKQLNFDEHEFRGLAGVDEHWGDSNYTLHERVIARPTMDVNGMVGGFIGEGAKTIIPSKASAKISFRLVANQDPKTIERLFREFVDAFIIPGITFHVHVHHFAPAVLVDRKHPTMERVQTVLQETWGNKPVFSRSGGSIPVVTSFAEHLGALPVLVGYGLPDDRLHSPNERMKLDMFWKGIRTTYELLNRLGS